MTILEETLALEKLLYDSRNIEDIENRKQKVKDLWIKISNRQDILRQAIEVKRGIASDTVTAISVCDHILNDYENEKNKDIYTDLINTIYSNTGIACLHGNRNVSFLLTTLLNDNLKLNVEQKKYLVEQAMKRPGTVLTKKNQKYINFLHYSGEYDIRDYILKNDNFSNSEKADLIPLFYANKRELLKIRKQIFPENEIQKRKKI